MAETSQLANQDLKPETVSSFTRCLCVASVCTASNTDSRRSWDVSRHSMHSSHVMWRLKLLELGAGWWLWKQVPCWHEDLSSDPPETPCKTKTPWGCCNPPTIPTLRSQCESWIYHWDYVVTCHRTELKWRARLDIRLRILGSAHLLRMKRAEKIIKSA